jgi:signal transduction histidine kinase
MNIYEKRIEKILNVTFYITVTVAIASNVYDLYGAEKSNIIFLYNNYGTIFILIIILLFNLLKKLNTKFAFGLVIMLLLINLCLGLVLYDTEIYTSTTSEIFLRESIMILFLISLAAFFVSPYLSYIILVLYIVVYFLFAYEHNNQFIILNSPIIVISFVIFTAVIGNFRQFIQNLFDVMHENNIEIQKSEEKFKKANATKDQFFSIISHDLRSPFHSMLVFSELLNTKFEEYDTEEQKKFLGYIHKGIDKTHKLLENLLLWSCSQKGSIDFKLENLNLYSIAIEIVELLHQAAENKSIKIINKISENIYVEADKDILSIIIRNLISNAIKFTHRNGNISLKAESNQQFTEITITDTGVGISKEMQSKLFDVGEKTLKQGTENEQGTGLGLILCKEFTEKHGGEIWVESEIDKGSTFIFTIPYKLENTNKNNKY